MILLKYAFFQLSLPFTKTRAPSPKQCMYMQSRLEGCKVMGRRVITSLTKATIKSSYKEGAGDLAENLLSSLVFRSSTFLLSQIVCTFLIRRPDRSFRGYQKIMIGFSICKNPIIKERHLKKTRLQITKPFYMIFKTGK